jgi:hypothetical protein
MVVDIITNIVVKEGYRSMKVVSIYAEIEKAVVRAKYTQKGAINPCSKAVPELLPEDIDDATKIVAQMGMEPWLKAMKDHPDFDIIVGGRSYDPTPYAAFCAYHGITDLGIVYHMGKIMECGAVCSVPKSREALATVRQDSFDIEALDPKSRCTKISVAAHTLYEKSRPDILLGPGGSLHLDTATYEELPDQRTVRVRGARFAPIGEGEYTIKLEAARTRGFHSMFIGGFRDSILISQIDSFLAQAKEMIKNEIHFPFELEFAVYGRDAIMGPLEPDRNSLPKELGIVGHARASTQEEATQVSHWARVYCLHAPYPHQRATGGNFALRFKPFDIPLGPSAEFCIYHTMAVEDPLEYFPIRQQIIPGTGQAGDLSRKTLKDEILVSTSSPSVHNRTGIATGNAGDNKVQMSDTLVKPSSSSLSQDDWSISSILNTTPPPGHIFLADLAQIIRSKNAGPYELTFDIMFPDEATRDHVKRADVLTNSTIARLYRINEDDIIVCLWWDPALAFKATIKRPMVSGGFSEVDMHGCAQHMPLMMLPVPVAD